MASKTYTSQFSPDQVVFHVSLAHGIRKGTVDKIQVVDDETTQIIYFIIFNGETKTTPVSADVYGELGSASAGSLGGGALEAYEDMLLAP